MDKNKFDVRVVSHDEAKRLLDRAQVYGELVIPPTFSSTLQEFGGKRGHGRAMRTGRRSRSRPIRAPARWASGIAGQTLNQAMAVVNGKVGQRLSARWRPQPAGRR